MEHRHKLDAHDPVDLPGLAFAFHGVVDFDQLPGVRTEPDRRLVSLSAGVSARVKVSRSRCQIPSRMKNSFRFEVSGFLAKRGKQMIGHIEVLPLAIEVPVATRPFRVSTHGGRGQVLRFGFTGTEEGFLAVEVRSAIRRKSYAQSLPDGVSAAAGPVAKRSG